MNNVASSREQTKKNESHLEKEARKLVNKGVVKDANSEEKTGRVAKK